MIEKLMRWLHEATRSKEKYSGRDGFLSYAGEWHAAIIGLGMGVYSWHTGDVGPMVALIGVSLGVAGTSKLPAITERIGRTIRIPKFPRKVVGEVRREPWYTIGSALLGYLGPSLTEVVLGVVS